MRKLLLIAALAALTIIVSAGAAFAAHNAGATNAAEWDHVKNIYGITPAKNASQWVTSSSCGNCHSDGDVHRTAGPHGGYTTTTKKCATCHTIHSNVGTNTRVGMSAKILPGQTVTGVCNFCHDLTGTARAPYYTNYMTSSTDVKSAHYVEGSLPGSGMNALVSGSVYSSLRLPGTAIPGGDIATGGTRPYANLFQQGDWSNDSTRTFTCDSCHTPHALSGQTVAPFFGETQRKQGTNVVYGSSRLLKKQLTVNGATYSDYGSAWCAGCHMGRLSMAGPNYNHPVNKNGLGYNPGMVGLYAQDASGTKKYTSTATGVDDAAKIAAINAGTPIWNTAQGMTSANSSWGSIEAYATGSTTLPANLASVSGNVAKYLDKDPRTNAWYTMTKINPLTGLDRADGYIPIEKFRSGVADENGPSCQQCHASERNVEEAFAGTGAPVAFNFPHISRTQYLLVQNNTDDLCTNCHGIDNLP